MLSEGSRFGDFLIDRKIGRGSTGTVYSAHSVDDQQLVALKVLHADLAETPGMRTMFEEEAQAGLQLSHPHIVKTIQVGCCANLPYIVFEHISGTALSTLLQRGPLPEGQCLWIMRQIGQALRQLAAKGIVHQDIKPDNILIDNAGNAKLTDLGFARRHRGKIDWDGFSAGTLAYMSPEEVLGTKGVPIDPRADLYSLGATIYHAATGQPPFLDQGDREQIKLRLKQKPVNARVRNPQLSIAFSVVLSKLLQNDLSLRYQHPEELLLELRLLKEAAVPPVVTASRIY